MKFGAKIIKGFLASVPLLLTACGGSDLSCKVKDFDVLNYVAADETTTLKYNWEQNVEAGVDAPVLVMVHGGGWTQFTKDQDFFYDRHPYVQNIFSNYNVASLNYRLFVKGNENEGTVDQNVFPTQRDDLITFIDHLKEEHNATKICLMGQSAGAHIATTTAIESLDSPGLTIDCIVGYAGLYDFRKNNVGIAQSDADNYYEAYLNSLGEVVETDPQEISPVDTLTNGYDIPTLISAGNVDAVVTPSQSTNWVDAINALPGDLVASFVEVTGIRELHNDGRFLGLATESDCELTDPVQIEEDVPGYAKEIADFIDENLN